MFQFYSISIRKKMLVWQKGIVYNNTHIVLRDHAD